MDELEPTLGRSLKIWWSFVWRGMLLMIAIAMPIEFIGFLLMFPHMHFPRAGEPPNPEDFKRMAKFFPIVWIGVMAAMVFAQALAMRWMLRKVTWSDFRLVLTRNAVTRDAS